MVDNVQGVVYVAYGEPSYFDELMYSLESVREHTNLPVCLISDKPVDGFDYNFVIQPKPGIPPLANKPYMLSQVKLPFRFCLFLDTDTLLLDDITPIFDLLEKFDIAATHSQYRTNNNQLGCPDFNTGVVLFDAMYANNEFFSDWCNSITENNDQPAFTNLVWDVYVLPPNAYVLPPEFNVRVSNQAFITGKAYILHGRHNRLQLAKETINSNLKPRIWDRTKLL